LVLSDGSNDLLFVEVESTSSLYQEYSLPTSLPSAVFRGDYSKKDQEQILRMNFSTKALFVISMTLSGAVLALINVPIKSIWPSIVALSIVLVTRRAMIGLLAGAVSGALILTGGNCGLFLFSLFSDHFIPHFKSSWKIGALVFTLLMGGFAAVLEKSGGFERIFEWLFKKVKDPSKSLQTGVMGLGLACFFDGLANSMLVGRVSRKLGAGCGVSREKLAYLVDSTSSAVACLAFVSTWIAYQLSMIREGFSVIGQEVNPYIYFVQSIPFNFYCWFTLVLCLVSIFGNFNPGGMQVAEASARNNLKAKSDLSINESISQVGSYSSVLVPLIVLLVGMVVAFYLVGLGEAIEEGVYQSLLPITGEKVSVAFGTSKGPYIMCLVGVIASIVAIILYPHKKSREKAIITFTEGARSMLMPLLILISAWMLSSTLAALKAGDSIAGLMDGSVPLWSIPSLVFLVGALISFTMGSSWGTMGILMPLAIPIIAKHPNLLNVSDVETIYAATVAAVFSGAVFGDHCSPISDTTIVSSIACGIEPHDHVRTQMPFALIAAVTAFVGFLVAGWNVVS
jgi:tetracycline resistance efflux pump